MVDYLWITLDLAKNKIFVILSKLCHLPISHQRKKEQLLTVFWLEPRPLMAKKFLLAAELKGDVA